MSIAYGQQVSIIGKSKDLVKIFAIKMAPPEKFKGLYWGLGPIHFSASQCHVNPPVPLTSISKEHPDLIFASTSFCDANYDSIYRWLIFRGKYFPVAEWVSRGTVDDHRDWANKLNYDTAIDFIKTQKPELFKEEIVFDDPVIE
jgi:hypothetical protein